MKYGYSLVSTDDQNPALQLAALKRAGCKNVFRAEFYEERFRQQQIQLLRKRAAKFGLWKFPLERVLGERNFSSPENGSGTRRQRGPANPRLAGGVLRHRMQ